MLGDIKIMEKIVKKRKPMFDRIKQLEAKKEKILYKITESCRNENRDAYKKWLRSRDEIDFEIFEIRYSILTSLTKKERRYAFKKSYSENEPYIPSSSQTKFYIA